MENRASAVEVEVAVEEVACGIDRVIGISEHFAVKDLVQMGNVVFDILKRQIRVECKLVHRARAEINLCAFSLCVGGEFVDVVDEFCRNDIRVEVDDHVGICAADHGVIVLVTVIGDEAVIVERGGAVNAHAFDIDILREIFRFGSSEFPEAAEHCRIIVLGEVAEIVEIAVERLPHGFRIEVERPCLCVHFGGDDDDVTFADGAARVVHHDLCAERCVQTEVDNGSAERFGEKLCIQTERKGTAADEDDLFAFGRVESVDLVFKLTEEGFIESGGREENDGADCDDRKRKYQQKRDKADP